MFAASLLVHQALVVVVCYAVLRCRVVSDSLWSHGLWPVRLLCPWDSSSKNTGVGCHAPLQGIFLTQGSNSCLLHWESGCLPHRKPLCTTGTSLKHKQFCCLTNPAYLSGHSWPHYGFWNEVSRQSSLETCFRTGLRWWLGVHHPMMTASPFHWPPLNMDANKEKEMLHDGK